MEIRVNSSVILDSLPYLEWSCESYDNCPRHLDWVGAVTAVSGVGGGWRLPSKTEFVELATLNSVWDSKRAGRLFEGKLFLSASGLYVPGQGMTVCDGLEGCYWSSTLDETGNAEGYAYSLSFSKVGVTASSCTNMVDCLSVCMVREVGIYSK